MPKFDPAFAFRDNWTWRPFRSVTQNSNKPKQTTPGDSPSSEPNQRKAPEQDESDYKRVDRYILSRSLSNENLMKTKKFKCPTEPFLETLRLLDEIL